MLSPLSKLDQKQLNTVPFDGSWTAAQLGDHVYKSCGAIETLNGKLAKTERAIDAKTKEIADLFLNYDIKMKSPTEIEPATTEIAKVELLSSLKARTDELVEFQRITTYLLPAWILSFRDLGP